MSRFTLRLFTLLVFCLGIFLSLCATPTQRYLEMYPLDEIVDMVAEDLVGDDAIRLGEKIPSLMEIASYETEDTFFGYHGTTQKVRLFQDILRVVFEEALHIPIPENFYFLRIPGQTQFNWKNSKNDFLERFEKKEISIEDRNLVIKNFLMTIKNNLKIDFALENFSAEELEVIWAYFQSYVDYYVSCQSIQDARQYNIPSEYSLRLPKFNVDSTGLIQVINKKISESQPEVSPDYFSSWMKKRYANPVMLIYVFYLEELDPEEKENKHFHYTYFSPLNDNMGTQQEMQISLNISLLGNYRNLGECSLAVLLNNHSISFGDSQTTESLELFFESIGLDPSLVKLMEEEGIRVIAQAEHFSGCLLQLFDESVLQGKQVMDLVDQNTFVSLAHGVLLSQLTPSKLIQGHYSIKKNSQDLQLRLVMNNKTTLNPFSTLRMIRHDELSAEDSEKIITRMKQVLRNSEKDQNKLQEYKKTLEEQWGGN